MSREPFLERQAVDGMDEDELQVEGYAEDEPVCDTEPELDQPWAGNCTRNVSGRWGPAMTIGDQPHQNPPETLAQMM